MSQIHPTAIIDATAILGDQVSVGAYSIIKAHSHIEAGCCIGPHVVIGEHTHLGEACQIFQFSSIGEVPQDKKYQNEPTRLIMGCRNTVREFVTINRGTVQDLNETRIGDDNWIMANCHIAHDCIIGHRNVFANGASMAGHAIVGSDVTLGGYAMIYQRCRIGDHAMIGFSSGIKQHVPPFVTADGYRAEPKYINKEGLNRRGFTAEQIAYIEQAFQVLYHENLLLKEAVEAISKLLEVCPVLHTLLDFLQTPSKLGIMRPSHKVAHTT